MVQRAMSVQEATARDRMRILEIVTSVVAKERTMTNDVVLLCSECAENMEVLRSGLTDAGYSRMNAVQQLTELVVDDSDVVLFDLANKSFLSSVATLEPALHANKPVAVFVDSAGADEIDQALEAGVSSFIVNGLHKNRVGDIVRLTLSRHRIYSRMRNELVEARETLANRAQVEKAKHLLMRLKGISEEEAYSLLRKTAMSQNRKIVDVASSLLSTANIFTADSG